MLSVVSKFKDYIENYDFNFKVDAEVEFNNLKKVLLSYPDFNEDTTNTDNFIESYFKNNKYNKLVKELEKFISKKNIGC